MHADARACAARARAPPARPRETASNATPHGAARRGGRAGGRADRFRDAFPIRMQPRAVLAQPKTLQDSRRAVVPSAVRRPPGPQRGSETESPPPPAWAAHGTATRPPPRTTAHWPLARTPCDAVLPRSRVRWVGEATHGRPHGHGRPRPLDEGRVCRRGACGRHRGHTSGSVDESLSSPARPPSSLPSSCTRPRWAPPLPGPRPLDAPSLAAFS